MIYVGLYSISERYQSRKSPILFLILSKDRLKSTHGFSITNGPGRLGSKKSWGLEFFRAWKCQWGRAGLENSRKSWLFWSWETTIEWNNGLESDSNQTFGWWSFYCTSWTFRNRMPSPRIDLTKLGNTFPWRECAQECLRHRREPGSYLSCSCLNSTTDRHASTVSTWTSFLEVLPYSPSLCHKPT